MIVDLWGLTDAFGLGLPLRWSGFLVLGLELLLVVLTLVVPRRRPPGAREAARPAPSALVMLGIAAQAVFVVRFPSPGGLATPGLPLQPSGPAAHLLGVGPLIVTAGWFGPGLAAAVGFAAGIVRAGWTTHSLLTPLDLALVGTLAAWMVRQSYGDPLGKVARRPAAAAFVAGLVYGVLRCVGLFVYSGGSTLDGLEYVVAQGESVFRAALLEAVVGGLAGEAALFLAPARWPRPARLTPAPYQRSLGTRMVAYFLLVGSIAGVVLLVGDWVLARASARDLVEDRMAQTAVQAGSGVPFFVQTGRSFLQQAAAQLEPAGGPIPVSVDGLRRLLVSFPFFQQMAVFDASGVLIVEASLRDEPSVEIGLDEEAALAAALVGVPQEVSRATDTLPPTSQVVFLVPAESSDGSSVIGVLAGWTDLGTNPLLQPVAAIVGKVPEGSASLVADDGTILLHSDPSQVGRRTTMGEAVAAEAVLLTAPDGTSNLAYVYPIPGSAWTIVQTVPASAVDRLAIPIAARLFTVMGAAGLIVVLLTYAVSRGLTRPLRQMTLAAEAIARGHLDRPVPGVGEDETGRLAAALDRMRRSLKGRLDEMDLLLRATQRMVASFDLAEVLPPILIGVQDLTQSDLVRVALAPRDDEAGELETFQAGVDPGGWATLDSPLLGLCRERGRLILENPARARALLDLRLLTEPLEGLLALPMRSEEEFVGTLWIGYRRPHLFTSDETSLLTILAGQLGVSVANARLYQRAEQERLRLGATLEATPDAVLLLDPRGGVLLANPAAEMVLRVSPEQARRKAIGEVLAVPRLVEMLREAGEGAASGEIPLPDGRVLFASALEIESVGPHRGGRVCVLRDITHYKKLDKLKSEFVATVSHDLRTPLTMMRGYGTMLSMVGALNDQQKDFARKILDSVDQMGRLVDGLLDLGRIEAGVGLSLETVQPAAILHDVVQTYRPQAANKRVALTLDVPDTLAPIEADPTLLRQAVANLVDNAIKYTPPNGRVRVSAEQTDGVQQFRVEDSGVGVAPADQPRLFEKFFRPRAGEGGRERGSGLGLAIVKSIAEQHGGRVTVESRLGSGSVFVLEVPVHQKARRAEGNTPAGEQGT